MLDQAGLVLPGERAAGKAGRSTQAVRLWLFAVAALIFVMVIVGGATRLTESGLSITEWKPMTGVIPPLTEAGWRVRSACDELFAVDGEGARGPGAVVVVSHVSPIKAATCWALGLGDEGAWRLYLATASITRITWGAAGPVLAQFNDTPWSGPGSSGPA